MWNMDIMEARKSKISVILEKVHKNKMDRWEKWWISLEYKGKEEFAANNSKEKNEIPWTYIKAWHHFAEYLWRKGYQGENWEDDQHYFTLKTHLVTWNENHIFICRGLERDKTWTLGIDDNHDHDCSMEKQGTKMVVFE